jgi:hypothetical protein
VSLHSSSHFPGVLGVAHSFVLRDIADSFAVALCAKVEHVVLPIAFVADHPKVIAKNLITGIDVAKNRITTKQKHVQISVLDGVVSELGDTNLQTGGHLAFVRRHLIQVVSIDSSIVLPATAVICKRCYVCINFNLLVSL